MKWANIWYSIDGALYKNVSMNFEALVVETSFFFVTKNIFSVSCYAKYMDICIVFKGALYEVKIKWKWYAS